MELGREYLVAGWENDAVKAYHKFIVDNAVVFGADRKRAEEELKDVIDFEIKLANVCELFFSFWNLFK